MERMAESFCICTFRSRSLCYNFPKKNKKEQKKVYGKGEIWKWLKEK